MMVGRKEKRSSMRRARTDVLPFAELVQTRFFFFCDEKLFAHHLTNHQSSPQSMVSPPTTQLLISTQSSFLYWMRLSRWFYQKRSSRREIVIFVPFFLSLRLPIGDTITVFAPIPSLETLSLQQESSLVVLLMICQVSWARNDERLQEGFSLLHPERDSLRRAISKTSHNDGLTHWSVSPAIDSRSYGLIVHRWGSWRAVDNVQTLIRKNRTEFGGVGDDFKAILHHDNNIQ